MPEYLIPAETFKKITEEGLSSVIKSARTARGRGWGFSLMEKAPVFFSDGTYAWLIRITGGADRKAWDHALAPIFEVAIPYKEGRLPSSKAVSEECKAFFKSLDKSFVSGGERIFLLANGAEGSITYTLNPASSDFIPIAQKRFSIKPKDLPQREFKLFKALTSQA